MNSSGIVRFLIAEPEIRFDVGQLDSPVAVIGKALILQNLNVGRAKLLRRATESAIELDCLLEIQQALMDGRMAIERPTGRFIGYFEDCRRFDGELSGASEYRASGWARNPAGPGPAEEVVVMAERRGERWAVATQQPDRKRADVARALSDPTLLYSGWSACLRLDHLRARLRGKYRLAAYALDRERRRLFPLGGDPRLELRF